MPMNDNWFKAMGLGSGLGTAAGGLAGLFGLGGGKNPSDAAMPYLNQIPDILKQYYGPWLQGGQNAMGQTQGIYDQMTNDPNAYYNKIAAGYKESPGYQTRLNQGLQAAGNAAAAGGMAGSPQHQLQAAQKATDLQSEDFNNYLNQVLGIGKTGLQGEENALTRGFNASGNMADTLSQLLGTQGQYAYGGQNWENQNKKSGLENIFSGIGSALPWMWF